MAFIFLSYAHADVARAARFEAALRDRGHRVWRDDSSLTVGTPIPQGVATGISICDYFAILVTKHSLESHWMKAELSLWTGDSSRWSRLLPLKFDDTDPNGLSPFLKLLGPKWADFSTSFDQGLQQVLTAVGPPDAAESGRKITELARLRFAIDLAVRAGNVAMCFYNASIGPNEPLDERRNGTTRADRAAQNEVVNRITGNQSYCHDGLISEEKPYNKGAVLEEGYTWVVDPLDGTVNFDNGIPLFCTAIGCLRNARLHVGVVYDPVENEVYYAMDGMPTEVWRVSKGEVQRVESDQSSLELEKSVLGIHISSRPDVAERFVTSGMLMRLSRGARHLRALGSGQLALAYVASGKLQGFLQLGTYLWDQVAGVVLVRGAGGFAVDLKSRAEWTSSTKDLLAVGNEQLRDSLLKLRSDKSPVRRRTRQ